MNKPFQILPRGKVWKKRKGQSRILDCVGLKEKEKIHDLREAGEV